jgi:hypothetical protein
MNSTTASLVVNSATLIVCLWAHTAAAQVIPPSAESGRIEKQLEKTPEPQRGDTQEPQSGARVIPVPAGTESVFLTFKSLNIIGVTVYSGLQLGSRSRAEIVCART